MSFSKRVAERAQLDLVRRDGGLEPLDLGVVFVPGLFGNPCKFIIFLFIFYVRKIWTKKIP